MKKKKKSRAERGKAREWQSSETGRLQDELDPEAVPEPEEAAGSEFREEESRDRSAKSPEKEGHPVHHELGGDQEDTPEMSSDGEAPNKVGGSDAHGSGGRKWWQGLNPVATAWASALACFTLTSFSVYLLFSREDGRWFALLLSVVGYLVVPFALVSLGKNSAFRPYIQLLTVVALPHLILVLFYTFRNGLPQWLLYLLMVFSLVMGVVVVALAFYFTCDLIRDGRRGGFAASSELLKAMEHDKFLALWLFLSLFMFSTLFLSFTLAFHDRIFARAHDGVSAFVVTQNVDVLIEEAELRGRAQDASISRAHVVYFREGDSRVAFDPSYAAFPRGPLVGAHDDNDTDRDVKELIERTKSNSDEIEKIISDIATLAQFQRVRVVVVGHANELPLPEGASAFDSNYELSEARANQVFLLLLKLLEERRAELSGTAVGDARGEGSDSRASTLHDLGSSLDWILVPLSSVKTQLRAMGLQPGTTQTGNESPGQEGGSRLFELDPFLSVEVAVVPVSEYPEVGMSGRSGSMELLDYLYFMVYTITTTAYGDIIPVSRYAKFVASIANLFEVIYLVIFFNALIARRGDG